jgi:lipopolysaccharide export system permease protein
MTLIGYISRLYAARFTLFLVTLAGLLQLVDLMERADEVLARGLGMAGMARYALLRLPLTIAAALPIAALAAAVLTFATLAGRAEISALRAAGLSLARLAAALVPAAAAVGAVQFVLSNAMVPPADAAFARWWGIPDGAFWFADGLDVVGVNQVAAGGALLLGIEVTQRQPDGRLAAIVAAERAEWEQGRWILLDGTRFGDWGAQDFARLPWPTRLSPANLDELARPAPLLSTGRLTAILAGSWAAREQLPTLRIRLLRLVGLPVIPVVMVLLACPVAGATRRGGGIPAGMAVGLAAGLSYLLLDGILAAMGEAGALPPVLAAWSAHAIFACAGGAALLGAEK